MRPVEESIASIGTSRLIASDKTSAPQLGSGAKIVFE
jgi:hypothetical protein